MAGAAGAEALTGGLADAADAEALAEARDVRRFPQSELNGKSSLALSSAGDKVAIDQRKSQLISASAAAARHKSIASNSLSLSSNEEKDKDNYALTH